MSLMLALPNVPRTYPHKALDAHWTDEDWRRLPLAYVDPRSLVTSQSDVSLRRMVDLMNGDDEPETGDYARAVRHDGQLYLHDGHHRWLVAVIRGDALFPVRIAVSETVSEPGVEA